MSDKIQTADENQLEPREKQNPVKENSTEEKKAPEKEIKKEKPTKKPDEMPAEDPAGTPPEIDPEIPEEVPADPPREKPEEIPQETSETVSDVPSEEKAGEAKEGMEDQMDADPPTTSVTEETIKAKEVDPVESKQEEEDPVESKQEEETPVLGKQEEEAPLPEGQKETEVNEASAEKKKAEKPGQDKEDEGEEDEDDKEDEDFVKQINTLQDSSDDHDDEEDEDEHEEEDHQEPPEKYEDFSRDQLLSKLEEVVEEENIQKIKTRVALIKVAFLKITREEQQEKLNAYLKEGGDKESYSPEPDPLMERFEKAFEVYRRNKARFNEEQEVLKLRNLDAKKQILEEIKELINSEESLKKTYDRFKELQTQWKEIGLVPATEINNLWQNYHFLVEKFFDKVKISKELRDLDLKKNMELKIELCEKAEELLLEPSIMKSFKQLQKYHEEWKEIGPVPADLRDEIWERFKTATDKINERRREHYSSLAEQREENLAKKNELCDEAENIVAQELTTIKQWQDNTRKINEIFNTWKTLGPAPKKNNDEVWERFKTYLNTFFSNKKEYFSGLKQEQTNNFNLKLDICKQAEALKDSTDWRETTRELIDLQKEWKRIGPVPRKHSDKIWKRFRAACDEFFHRKSEHFGNLQQNEKENLEKKLELIRRVQEYEFGSNKGENLQVLKDFQREWMEIGHVPIKEKDKVQRSFRDAISQHMDNLNIRSSEIRISEGRPRQDSGRDRSRGDSGSPMRKEMGFLTGKINKLKEDIQLWENNIGFLANSKRADLVKKEFEEKIEKAKEELEMTMAKLKELQEAED